MSNLRIIISRRASKDLDAIWEYIAQDGTPVVASKVISKILDSAELLKQMPGLGHRRPDLPEEYRVWTVYKFLIIYHFDARALHIMRVVHGNQNIKQIFHR